MCSGAVIGKFLKNLTLPKNIQNGTLSSQSFPSENIQLNQRERPFGEKNFKKKSLGVGKSKIAETINYGCKYFKGGTDFLSTLEAFRILDIL